MIKVTKYLIMLHEAESRPWVKPHLYSSMCWNESWGTCVIHASL